ncbi:MAG: DUF3822 family protein [Muribaculaceae bacterium]|nr:DUF3822 family protein [Muribaculaceae bacterium]
MGVPVLDTTLIAQPELWRLVMLLGTDRLDVALLPPVDSEEAIYRAYMLDGERGTLKAAEDVIYSNPLLLSDFKSIECVADMPHMLMVPSEVAPADYECIMDKAFGEQTGDDAMTVSAIGADGAVAVTSMDTSLKAFLTRTFFNIRFDSALARLCRRFAALQSGNEQHRDVFVCFRGGKVDIVVLEGRRLVTANSIPVLHAADAAFFIAATRSEYNAEESMSVHVCGDMELAAQVGALLAPDGISLVELPASAMRFRPSEQTAKMPPQLVWE